METIRKRNEEVLAMLVIDRTIHYGRATVPASVDNKLRVMWHLPNRKATASEKHALMIARRMNLIMGGSENGVR